MRGPATDPSRSRRGVLMALCVLVASLAVPPPAGAQEEPSYVEETDPLVLQKLEAWQDLKLGLLMHWGPYSQWGIVESWSVGESPSGRRRASGPPGVPA